jgi:hypothetical protein
MNYQIKYIDHNNFKMRDTQLPHIISTSEGFISTRANVKLSQVTKQNYSQHFITMFLYKNIKKINESHFLNNENRAHCRPCIQYLKRVIDLYSTIRPIQLN